LAGRAGPPGAGHDYPLVQAEVLDALAQVMLTAPLLLALIWVVSVPPPQGSR
jgi:hypothetical protein